MLDALSGAGAHLLEAVGVVDQLVDGFGEVAGEPGGVPRLEVGPARGVTGTSNPVLPGTTTSMIPPTAEATTGVPQAIASRLMIPNGS